MDKKKEPGFHYEKRKVVRFKLRPNREKMDKRKCTSEHLFGTIKRWHDSGYFLLKGMRKVDGEFFSYGKGAESRVVGQMPNMISRRNNCSAIRL